MVVVHTLLQLLIQSPCFRKANGGVMHELYVATAGVSLSTHRTTYITSDAVLAHAVHTILCD